MQSKYKIIEPIYKIMTLKWSNEILFAYMTLLKWWCIFNRYKKNYLSILPWVDPRYKYEINLEMKNENIIIKLLL